MTETISQETKPGDKRLYKSHSKFCGVVTPKGHKLSFKAGMFATDNVDYITWLDKEIAEGGFAGTIYIDPNAKTITAEQENPMLALEKMFYAKFLAEQQRHVDPANDMGKSTAGPLNAASTSSIAAVTAGGDATARLIPVQGSQLANLAAAMSGSEKA